MAGMIVTWFRNAKFPERIIFNMNPAYQTLDLQNRVRNATCREHGRITKYYLDKTAQPSEVDHEPSESRDQHQPNRIQLHEEIEIHRHSQDLLREEMEKERKRTAVRCFSFELRRCLVRRRGKVNTRHLPTSESAASRSDSTGKFSYASTRPPVA